MECQLSRRWGGGKKGELAGRAVRTPSSGGKIKAAPLPARNYESLPRHKRGKGVTENKYLDKEG